MSYDGQRGLNRDHSRHLLCLPSEDFAIDATTQRELYLLGADHYGEHRQYGPVATGATAQLAPLLVCG